MFDPKKHLTKIKGKDYLEVKFRLHWFRQEKPLWDVKTEIIKLDTEKGIAAVRSDIYDEQGIHKSSGLSLETMKSFPDYLEKAETSATGRALAVLGYGTLQSVELEEGKIADSPVRSGANNRNATQKPQNNNGFISAQQVKDIYELAKAAGCDTKEKAHSMV